jgi:hypothetical protein
MSEKWISNSVLPGRLSSFSMTSISIENNERLPVGRKVAEAKLIKLDALIGTPLWRKVWSGEPVDTHAAMDATVELYLSELRKRISYANEIKMRDAFSDRAAYRLVFCTDSPHGVELMSTSRAATSAGSRRPPKPAR